MKIADFKDDMKSSEQKKIDVINWVLWNYWSPNSSESNIDLRFVMLSLLLRKNDVGFSSNETLYFDWQKFPH